MKILVVSDLHMDKEASKAIAAASSKVPYTLCGGDIAMRRDQPLDQVADYMRDTFKSEYTFVTPGNHDFWPVNLMKLYGPSKGISVVVDRAINLFEPGTHRIIRVWFSPWSTQFWDWNWMLDDVEEDYVLPNDLDMVVTHGPAYGICDLCPNGDNAGSIALKKAINLTQARYIFSGHIHGDDYDCRLRSNRDRVSCGSEARSWYNTSVVDERYRFKGALPVFDTELGEMTYWDESDWS